MNNNDQPGRNPTDEQMRLIVAPFARWNTETMNNEINKFIREAGLQYDEDSIRRGAKLAQDENAFKRPRDALEYRDNEEECLRSEAEGTGRDKFNQTWTLYSLVLVCSIGAAVQGWDESAVSSAQIYFQYALNIQGTTLGLVNAAPYLCCAITCWLNHPLNKLFGRRGTIFIACFVSFVTCLGQGFVQTWQQLFVARLLLGFGIGPKSATIPVFAAECAPANIRGALVMMWQMWTAAGIMFGYVAGVALHAISDGSTSKCYALGYYSYHYNGSDNSTIQLGVLPPRPTAINPTNIYLRNVTNTDDLLGTNCSLNWRMMLAAPMILPLVVMAYIYTVPESPRWLLQRAHNSNNPSKKMIYRQKAWVSLCRLRHTRLQAARDLFLIHHLLKNEREIFGKQNGLKQLFTQARSRRALLASVIVMFLQQFCGVNVHVYYSVSVFYEQARYSATQALLLGMGFGIINFVFALPAVFTIDTFGRRNLLLSTFPFMAIFQAFIAIALAADSSNRPLLLVGMYLFAVAYSPGEGPVPFVYSAESMPLYNRDLGMGIATAVLWLFNGVLAITYPQFLKSFTPAGTFGWYAAWCGLGWFMILLFVPETKDLTLEELDKVFSLKTSKHMTHGIRQFNWFIKRYLFWQRFAQKPVLVHPGEHPEETDPSEVGSHMDRPSIGSSEFSSPATYTIDKFERRSLPLLTFPSMKIFQRFIAIALGVAEGQTKNALLLVGMYLFAVAYSLGEGPVPFVYAAESMPIYNRDYGMGIVTAMLWLFNFVLEFTTPQLVEDDAFRQWGTFLWYGAWCVIGWWAILLFVPETKELYLAQLNKIFQKSTSAYVAHRFEEIGYFVRRFLFDDRTCRRPNHLGMDKVEFEFSHPGPEEDDRVGGRPPMEMFKIENDSRRYEREV